MNTKRQFAALALALSIGPFVLSGSDFRDSPALSETNLTGALDLSDLYVFRSPLDSDNTVLILTMSEFANVISPITFDPEAAYEFQIDRNGDLLPDTTLRVTFSKPNGVGFVQIAQVTMSRPGLPDTLLLRRGQTGENTSINSGGEFSAGLFDDPAFFDMAGFLKAVENGDAFPRETGAVNYFGPKANCLGIVLELPTVRLVAHDDHPVINVWARVIKKGKQVDRIGQPFTNLFLIPSLPKGDHSQPELHNKFNLGRPLNDSRHFRSAAIDVLENFWGSDRNRAAALVDDLFLPDVLRFDTSLTYFKTSTYPNGRALRDDVGDAVLKLVTGNNQATDGVDDDNGTEITDGNANSVKKFPYLGKPHVNPSGPPVEGN